MLKQETKTKLKNLGFDVEKFISAVTHAEEQDFEIPAINNYSEADLATRDENTRKEGAKEGKKNGIEIATKTIAEKFNIPVAEIDLKRPETLVEKINANITGGDATLKEQIKLLQADKQTLTLEKETAVKEAKQSIFDRDLITKFPANRTKLINDSELLSIVKGNLSFEEVDGTIVAKKGGQVLTDPTTRNPLPLDKVVSDFFTERKFIESGGGEGGRGGGDHSNSGGGIKKLSQFVDKWESEGKNPMSPEFHTALQAAVKGTTDFDMNG